MHHFFFVCHLVALSAIFFLSCTYFSGEPSLNRWCLLVLGDKENVFCLITLGVEYSDNTVGSEQKNSSEAIIVLQAHCRSIFLKNLPVVKCWSQCVMPVRIISFSFFAVEYRNWMGHLNLTILSRAHGYTTLRIVNQIVCHHCHCLREHCTL